MKVSDRKYEPTVEENECYICGKDLDGKDNEAKCESCLKSYNVACMNISHEDKLNNISLVWICLCGYNNISVCMFDHLGIPTDINQYESISPKHEIIEEPDGRDDDCFIPREKARDKKGRFVKKKRYVKRGEKRSISPEERNSKKRRNEKYVDDLMNSSTSANDFSESLENVVSNEKESDSRWELIRSRKAKLLEKRQGKISEDDKCQHKEECAHENIREKGVTYIGKAMRHLYYKPNRKRKDPRTENPSKVTQEKKESKMSVPSRKKEIEILGESENDLKVVCTGTFSHEEKELCKDGNEEHCLRSNEMAMLYSEQKSPGEWTSADIDGLVTCSNDMFSTSHGDDFASVCKKDDITSLGELKTGPLTNYTHQDSLLNKIEESLENCDGCIMNFGKQTFLIISNETGYYIFDGHSRSKKGCQSKQGKSILMHTKTWLGVYTYCIQLSNSMKLSCDETYSLRQVKVNCRSSTDTMKCQIEDHSGAKTESNTHFKEVNLTFKQSDSLKVQTEPTKPRDEVTVNFRPLTTMNNWSQNDSKSYSQLSESSMDSCHELQNKKSSHDNDFSTLHQEHRSVTDSQPKQKVTAEEIIELHRVENTQEEVLCEVSQGSENVKLSESAVVHPIVPKRNEELNGNVMLRAKPMVNVMKNSSPENMQYASKLRSECPSQSDLNNEGNSNGNPIERNHQDKCTRIDTHIKYIAQGTFNQGDIRFGNSSGKQCVANSLSALLYSKVKSAHDWRSTDLDSILTNGNELYCYIRHFTSLDHEYLLISDLYEYLDSYDELFKIECRDSVSGLLDGDDMDLAECLSMPLKQALEKELCNDSDACFVTFADSTFMVISSRDGYFIFDSHSRNRRGLLVNNGYSVLLCTPSWQGVYKHCIRLAKTMGCPVNTQYEVTSVCAKAISGKNETLKGYPQIQNIPDSQIPLLSRHNESYPESSHPVQCETFDEIQTLEQSIPLQEVVYSQDLFNFPENGNEEVIHDLRYDDQQLKLKNVRISVTKLKEPHVNHIHPLKRNDSIKAEFVTDQKENSNNCTKTGNDPELNAVDKVHVSDSLLSRKRKLNYGEINATDRNIRRKSVNGVVLQPGVTYIGRAIKTFYENRKKKDGNQKKDVYKESKNVNYERKGDVSLQPYTETFLGVYAKSVKSPHSMKEYEETCIQIDKMQYRSWADVASNSSPLSRTNSSADTDACRCNLFEQMTDLQKYRVHAGGKKGQVQGRNKKGQFRKKNKGIDESNCDLPLMYEKDDNESVRNDKLVNKECVNVLNHLKNSDKSIKLDNDNGKDLSDQNQKHDAMKCMNESDKGIDLNACKCDVNSDQHSCNMTDGDVQSDSNANVEESEDSASDIDIPVKRTRGRNYVESGTDTSHCEDDLVSSSLPKNDKSSQCTITCHDDATCHISTVSDTISLKREPNKKNSDIFKRYNDCNSKSSLEPLSDLNIKDEDNENAKEDTVHTCSDESGNEVEFVGTLDSCDRPDKYFQFLPLEKNEKQNICKKMNIRYVGRDCNARLERDSFIGVPSHIKIIDGDGNCFFRAISYAISGTESNHAILRNATAEHLLETGDMFCNTLRREFKTVREYVLERRIMEDGTWVTDTEISALANLIDTDIYSYNDQVPCWQLFSARKPGRINVLTSDKGIYIQYTGNIHFNAVETVTSVKIHSLQNTRTSEEDNVLRRTLLTASNYHDVKAKHVSKKCRSKWQFKEEMEEVDDKSLEKNQGHVDLKLRSDHEAESLDDNKRNMKGQTHKVNPEQKCTPVNMQIKQVAQGTFNQGDRRFGYSAGKQCVANSLSAVLYSKVKNANDWNSKDLDRILINGDELYHYIRQFISREEEYLFISDLVEYLDAYDELFEIEYCESVAGLLEGDESMLSESLSMPLKQALEQELCRNYDACFVTFGGNTFIVLSGKDGFFIFDSHSRSSRGLLTDSGCSVLLNTSSWQGVYKHCMRLAKTMGRSIYTEYEVTSVCAKALSGKNETLKGYPELQHISFSEMPSNRKSNSGNSVYSMHYESFHDLPMSNDNASPEIIIDIQDSIQFPEKANEEFSHNVCYKGQKLKLKNVTVSLTKLKEPQLNEGNNFIKANYVNGKKESLKDCSRYGSDSDRLEKFMSTSSRKRKLSNLGSDVRVNANCKNEIPKSKLPKRKENDTFRVDQSEYGIDNNEELMIIGEAHSTLYFKPLDEIRKKECCQRLNVAYTSTICNPIVERCVPIGPPKDIRLIKADGNCFYRAVSFAITGNERNHHSLREAVVLHLLHNQDRFVSFLRTDYTSILDYISSNNVQESGTWATEMEILVLANLIEIDIYVYDDEDFRWSIFCGQNVQIGKETTEKGIYLRNTQHMHYDVILTVQSSVALNYTCESDMYEVKNIIGNARKSMKEESINECKNVLDPDSSSKKRQRKYYNKTRKYNKERMRKKRALAKIETANKKKENHICSVSKRKMKEAIKKKFKYHCDLYWKSQVKQKVKERQKQKYRQDLSYKKKQVSIMRDKYNSDLQYRNKISNSGKQKYSANKCYNENKKIATRNRYQKDENFRQKHKAYVRLKYQKNENFRRKHKAYVKLKYQKNENFKRKHKAYVRLACRYQKDKNFMQKHKINIRLKYQKDENFRQKHKVGIRDRYHKDEQFKEVKKTAVRNRYKKNEKLRQIHKLAMKILSRTRYNKENVRQKKLMSLKVKYKKIEKYRQKVKEQNLKRAVVKKLIMSKFDNVLQEFRKIVSHGPEFVCSVCFKLLFENQVLKCTKSKYKLQTCISEKYLHVCMSECSSDCQVRKSARSSLWICYTCHKKLLSGKVPAEANMNSLQLHEVPDELANLNTLEQHLIALNIPFMKLMALPRGGQNGVHGPVVCVPSNTFDTVQTLPRPQTEDQLIRVKLKRKLSYKGHYEYKFVDKSKLLNALQYLKTNNKYYFDVTVNDEWENSLERNEKDNKEETLEISGKARLKRYWKEVLESLDSILSKDKNANESMQENKDRPSNKLDANDTEDDEERLQGIHLDSCLQPADIAQEILDQYFDDIICCAPCEGKSPVSILQDDSNEAKCFPVLFPQGQPTFHDSRKEKITLGRYLQNRLMHVDNRFAQNTDYIFYAQYIYEIQQVLAQVSIALRQSRNKKDDSSSITASDLKNAEKVQSLLKSDKGYKFLKQIRGTPPYWQKTQKDILAMVRQLGQPTFFASFSCADMRWPEIINTLLRQKGDTRKSSELDWNEKCNLIKSNPVTVARMFDKRFHTFVSKVILSPAAPIGKISEYVYRMEVQSRGSLHVHSLWWVEHAPKLGIDDDNEVVKFIDKYISCRKPSEEEDPELHEIISVQQHSKKHSKTCRKKGTKCRFNFPRPPSEKTFIVKPVEESKPKKFAKSNPEIQDDSHVDSSEKNKNDAKELLNSVKDALSVGTDYNSARHLFEKLGITQNQFESAHNEIASQESIIIKREPQDVWVNQFNPELLRAWNANMDLQYVTNAYACVAYIVSYMSKAEREMGMLLSQTLTEMKEGNKDAKESMKKLGQVYMQNREVSAQESVYRVCSLRLKECSRKVEFIPVGPDPVRMSLPLSIIKTRPECNDDDGDNQNIWMPSKLDRYKARPTNSEFKNMCLATFCSDYRVLTSSQVQCIRSKNIFKLSNNLGYIQKRSRTKGAVVRYPRFSQTISPESYYMSILQLFLPHYSDEQLKPPGFETYQEFYETGSVKICGCELEKVSSIVCTNRHKFEINADSIDQANTYVEQFGIQEDAWGLLCPESEVERLEHPRQHVDVEDCGEDLAIPDLNPETKKDVYSIEFRSAKISKEDRHSLMRSLNKKQKSVFYKIRQWCLDRVNGKLVEPFHIFITGGAGTGKSHLVKCLDYEATRILARMMHHPDDVSVLKLAPTGVAAYNINGHTIHSALSVPVKAQMPYQPLSEEKISVLRNKLAQLEILIIDEVSMVDQKLMCYIHSRLRQIKQSRNQAAFAGVSVIAVGDMYQLPPVMGNPLYKDTLHGALWNDNFKKVELEDIMRQKDDTEFAFLLNRLRVKERDDILHDKDLAMLKSCETGEVCEDALHIYSCNKEVDEWNKKLLHKKCVNVICIKAEDTEKDVKNRCKSRDKPCTRLKTHLPSYLWIAVNARVMLLKNIDVSKGLTNGCFGNVEEIIMNQAESKPVCIRVKFDKAHIGIHLIEKSEELIGNKYVRKQFPLKLAYACTIHKVQGLTLDRAVVSLKDTFQSGQAYVGLSRVTSLSGLVIEHFNPKRIYCNPEIKERLDIMNPFVDEDISEDNSSHTLSLILQNVQGLRQHFRDFQSQFQVVNADVFCLTETWINDDNISDVVMNNFRFYHQPRNTSYCKSGTASAFKELSHGGVAMYIQKPHSSRLNISVDNLEFMAVLLTKPVSVVVSVVYRPPSYNVKSFCQCLDNLLNELSKRSTRCIVMGDFNEDLFKCSSQTNQLMCKRGYKQHVVSATTENGTLIDHVYSRGIDSLETQVIPTYYSYHEAIKVIF